MNAVQEHNINEMRCQNININLLYSNINMAKRPRHDADNVICGLDGDYFLDELDDPREPVMVGSYDEFSDSEDIDELISMSIVCTSTCFFLFF